MPDNALYTILVDYAGGTYISQVKAANADQALATWCDIFPKEEGVPKEIWRLARNVRKEALEGSEVVAPLNNLVSAWCTTAIFKKKLALINIVQTAEP